MSGVNKVIIVGHLGKDPEMKYTATGAAIANIAVATSENWKDKKTGEKVEKTEWHRIVAFQRLAEIMGEYLVKGSLAYIEGKLQTRKWQDKDGKDRYTTEIVASNMQMLGGKVDKPAQQTGFRDDTPTQPVAPDYPGSQAPEFDDSDIPF